jgi:hypothetical protein
LKLSLLTAIGRSRSGAWHGGRTGGRPLRSQGILILAVIA